LVRCDAAPHGAAPIAPRAGVAADAPNPAAHLATEQGAAQNVGGRVVGAVDVAAKGIAASAAVAACAAVAARPALRIIEVEKPVVAEVHSRGASSPDAAAIALPAVAAIEADVAVAAEASASEIAAERSVGDRHRAGLVVES